MSGTCATCGETFPNDATATCPRCGEAVANLAGKDDGGPASKPPSRFPRRINRSMMERLQAQLVRLAEHGGGSTRTITGDWNREHFPSLPFDNLHFTALRGRAVITLHVSAQAIPDPESLVRVLGGLQGTPIPKLHVRAFTEGPYPIVRIHLLLPDDPSSPYGFEVATDVANANVQDFCEAVIADERIDLILCHEKQPKGVYQGAFAVSGLASRLASAVDAAVAALRPEHGEEDFERARKWLEATYGPTEGIDRSAWVPLVRVGEAANAIIRIGYGVPDRVTAEPLPEAPFRFARDETSLKDALRDNPALMRSLAGLCDEVVGSTQSWVKAAYLDLWWSAGGAEQPDDYAVATPGHTNHAAHDPAHGTPELRTAVRSFSRELHKLGIRHRKVRIHVTETPGAGWGMRVEVDGEIDTSARPPAEPPPKPQPPVASIATGTLMGTIERDRRPDHPSVLETVTQKHPQVPEHHRVAIVCLAEQVFRGSGAGSGPKAHPGAALATIQMIAESIVADGYVVVESPDTISLHRKPATASAPIPPPAVPKAGPQANAAAPKPPEPAPTPKAPAKPPPPEPAPRAAPPPAPRGPRVWPRRLLKVMFNLTVIGGLGAGGWYGWQYLQSRLWYQSRWGTPERTMVLIRESASDASNVESIAALCDHEDTRVRTVAAAALVAHAGDPAARPCLIAEIERTRHGDQTRAAVLALAGLPAGEAEVARGLIAALKNHDAPSVLAAARALGGYAEMRAEIVPALLPWAIGGRSSYAFRGEDHVDIRSVASESVVTLAAPMPELLARPAGLRPGLDHLRLLALASVRTDAARRTFDATLCDGDRQRRQWAMRVARQGRFEFTGLACILDVALTTADDLRDATATLAAISADPTRFPVGDEARATGAVRRVARLATSTGGGAGERQLLRAVAPLVARAVIAGLAKSNDADFRADIAIIGAAGRAATPAVDRLEKEALGGEWASAAAEALAGIGEPARAAVLRVARSGGPQAQSGVIPGLSTLAWGPDLADVLITLLRADTGLGNPVRAAIVQHGSAAAPVLSVLLDDEDATLRRWAAGIAAGLPTAAPTLVPGLLRAIQDKDGAYRMQAAKGLMRHASGHADSVASIVSFFVSSPAAVADDAQFALEGLGAEATPALAEVARRGTAGAKLRAVRVLGRAGVGPVAIDALTDAEKRGTGALRQAAREALASIRARTGIPR